MNLELSRRYVLSQQQERVKEPEEIIPVKRTLTPVPSTPHLDRMNSNLTDRSTRSVLSQAAARNIQNEFQRQLEFLKQPSIENPYAPSARLLPTLEQRRQQLQPPSNPTSVQDFEYFTELTQPTNGLFQKQISTPSFKPSLPTPTPPHRTLPPPLATLGGNLQVLSSDQAVQEQLYSCGDYGK
jgi:hypothetical protein